MLCESNSILAINKINNHGLHDVTTSSSNSSNVMDYSIEHVKVVRVMRKSKRKAVHFSPGDDVLLVTMSDEDMNDIWCNQNDLINFRNELADEARYIFLNKTQPEIKLQKAYHAARNGNLKSASAILQQWCSFTNHYACLRGIENLFRTRTLQKLENDRKLSIEKVMRLQVELLNSYLCKDEKYEIIKKAHEKTCKSSRYFSFAMGIANSLVIENKDGLKPKSRTFHMKLSKTMRISRQA